MTKRGMRGFAAGLWVAAVVMALFYFGTHQSQVPLIGQPSEDGSETVTQEQVTAYLEHNGKVAIDQETYQTLKTTDSKTSADNNNDSSSSDKQKDTSSQKQSSDDKQTKQDDQQSSDSSSKAKQNKENHTSDNKKNKDEKQTAKTITLKIEKGMLSGQVIEQLVNKQIIKKPDKLRNYLQEHDLADQIQLGSFKVSSDMSIAEIAKILTS